MLSWIVILIVLILACALVAALSLALGVSINGLFLYLCKTVTKSPAEAENLANITGFLLISLIVCVPLYSLTGAIGPVIFLVCFAAYRQRSG